LSNVLPNGFTNPYATVENGWVVGPQPVDPSSGAPGPVGPLADYVGANVEALSGQPANANANAATGGPATDPYETSQTLDELWNALGGKSLDMSQAVADNSNTVPASNSNTQTATNVTQAPANVRTIALADGNSLVVGSDGVASVYDAQGNQIYNVFPLQNGGGYFFQATDLSSPNTYFFNDSANANIQQSPITIAPVTIVGDTLTPAIEAAAQGRDLMAAILDSVSQPSAPSDPPPANISEVLAGTDSAPSQSQQSSQPAPTGPTGASQDDQNWDAAKAGMWDSFVDLVGGAVNGLLAPMGPPGFPSQFAPQIPFDWAKFGPPASTGNAKRDADLLDNYRRGGWVTDTIALAAPIGAEGLLDSATSAAGRLHSFPGGGLTDALGEELGTLPRSSGANGSELPALGNDIGTNLAPASPDSRFRQAGGLMNWSGRNFAVVTDEATGTTRIWYQSSGANATAGTWYPTYGIDTENALGQGTNWIAKGLDAPQFLYSEQGQAEAAGKDALSSTLNEAIRGGAQQYDGAFQWANNGGIQGTPVPSMPAEINAAGIANGAPVIEQTISRFMTRLYGGW
jgi:hypothetical protein